MRPYSHLSEDERDQIGVLRAAGRSMGAIARALGRAKATISRELQRNALPLGGYSPLHAAGAYQLRRRREAILEREAALRLFVGDRLELCRKLGDDVNQAADLISATASIPSLNFIPLTTFGNWF
jgi:IS30 family transposase